MCKMREKMCLYFLLLASTWIVSARSNLLQETCFTNNGFVVNGATFSWVDVNGSLADVSSCAYTDTATNYQSETIPFSKNASLLRETGKWNFRCSDRNLSGTVSVVPSFHVISLAAKQLHNCYAIGVGDVVSWINGDGHTCVKSIEITENSSNNVITLNLTAGGSASYQFTKKGIYHVNASNLSTYRHSIVVLEHDVNNVTEEDIEEQCSLSAPEQTRSYDCDKCSYKENFSEGLILSHASIMSVCFGILLPVGVFLANNGSPFAHKIFQPGGIILAIVGYGLVLVYIEVEEKKHFNSVHAIMGFSLVLLTVLMPFLRLRKDLHYLHKKCGIVIVFYGMANVLLGLVTIRCAPVYAKILYGAWLLVSMAFYVFWKSIKRNNSSNGSTWNGCCSKSNKTDSDMEMDYTPYNLRRLSRNVISDDKFVTMQAISEEDLHKLALSSDPPPVIVNSTGLVDRQQSPAIVLPHHVVTRSDSLRVTRHSERAKDYDPLTGTFKEATPSPSPNFISERHLNLSQHIEHSDEDDYNEEMKDKFSESNDNVFAESPTKSRLSLTNGGTPNWSSSDQFARSRARANTMPVDLEKNHHLQKNNRFESLPYRGEAIVCADGKGNIVYWGDGAIKMFGYTPNEAMGSSLTMLMPSDYQHKHQNGLDSSTESAIKYLRKHQYAPEFQKHARLYEVRALSKNGEKFPVEVNVSSFVVDEDIYYAAILRDLSQTRKLSTMSALGSSSADKEFRMKKKALLVGATMKFTHDLKSPEYITKEELRKVMSESLQTAQVETKTNEIDEMINDIVRAGGSGDNEDSISYLDLLRILSQHGLHIRESGLIARHSKQNNKNIQMNWTEMIRHIFIQKCQLLLWLLVYIILNVIVYVVASITSNSDSWKRWADGSNPVLCLNLFLMILPTMRSVLDTLHSHTWLNKVLPLEHRTVFHVVSVLGIFFWSAVHVVLHLHTYATENDSNNSTSDSTERLWRRVEDNQNLVITGGLAILFLLIMSIKSLRVLFSFVVFYTIHLILSVLVYLLVFIHGTNYVSSYFWKWLIPIVFLWLFELLHRKFSCKLHNVEILEACTTGDFTIYKVVKPRLFKFTPGQYLSVSLPTISKLSWNHCYIFSAPSDKFLSFVVQKKGCWGNQVYKTVFVHPQNSSALSENNSTNMLNFRGPYGEKDHPLFDYQCSLLVCEDDGLITAHSLIKQFTKHVVTKKGNICNCCSTPALKKLFFIWVSKSKDTKNQWFIHFLTEVIEGGTMPTLVDARVYFTDTEKPPDDLAALMLDLGIAMSQPQLRRNTYSASNIKTISVNGVPDFEYILQGIQAQNLAWEVGIFSLGHLHPTLSTDLKNACNSLSESSQASFHFHPIST